MTMTRVIGTVQSAVRAIVVLDVDARKAMQARWSYQAHRLGQAIEQGNAVAEAKAMATLILIETEAMRAGLIDDLDTGGCDGAVKRPMSEAMKRTMHQHHAQVNGDFRHMNTLVGLKMNGQIMIGDESRNYPLLEITGHEIAEIPGSRKVKVELENLDLTKEGVMALGKRQQPLVDRSGQGPVLPVPKSEAGKGAGVGRSLAQAAPMMVSKAEQLKAMKKAQAGQTQGKSQPQATATAKAKKVKFITKCLDGCGQDCGGRFAIGHDAKLKSLLIKIENGVEDVSSVPEIVRPFVKFGKPVVTVETLNGKEVQVTHYPLLMAPVRLPGRDDVEYVQDLGEAFGNK